MAPITHANFMFNWTIEWPEFTTIPQKKMSKIIILPKNHVVYYWRVELSGGKDGKISYKVFYEDGPLEKIQNIKGNVELYDAEMNPKVCFSFGSFDVKRGEAREFGQGWRGYYGVQEQIWFEGGEDA